MMRVFSISACAGFWSGRQVDGFASCASTMVATSTRTGSDSRPRYRISSRTCYGLAVSVDAVKQTMVRQLPWGRHAVKAHVWQGCLQPCAQTAAARLVKLLQGLPRRQDMAGDWCFSP